MLKSAIAAFLLKPLTRAIDWNWLWFQAKMAVLASHICGWTMHVLHDISPAGKITS
jgi:hypothetical protein